MSEEIAEYNKKWLEYMESVDIATVKKCPNGHELYAYNSAEKPDSIVICCPKGSCDYYDYNTFRVPVGTRMVVRNYKENS